MDSFLKIFGALALFVLAILWATIIPAFVANDCYNWFVKPVLHTPDFSLTHFIGFSFFLSAIVPRDHTQSILKKEFKIDNEWSVGIIGPIFLWIFAWLVHQFIG